MIHIDAAGKVCPLPVIETRKAIKSSGENETIVVMVDNLIATQNLQKMADELGVGEEFSVNKLSDQLYQVTIKIGQGKFEEICEITGNVLSITSDIMGHGDEEIGTVLLEGFFYSLNEGAKLPQYIIFYNKGVLIPTLNIKIIEDLKALEQKGVTILSCGACLDYYKVVDKLSVGSVTNMYKIVELLNNTDKIITL